VWWPVVSGGRDAEYSEFVAARLSSLRRLAGVLCGDWQRADDLVQATLVTVYVRWGRLRAAAHPDAYARAVLVREWLWERRSGWGRRVRLGGPVAEAAAAGADPDVVLDLRAAVAALPPRQRATLVLRFYCDLTVEQAAQVLGCSPGTVKSQTARALETVRRTLGPPPAAGAGGQRAAAGEQPIYPGGPGRE